MRKLQVEVEIWEDEVPCCRDSWFGRLGLGCLQRDQSLLPSCKVKIG